MTKKRKLNTLTYVLLFVGALAGGFVSGLAGFGTALMALGIWLYVLPPSLAVPLVLICSVVAQNRDAAVDVAQLRFQPDLAVHHRRAVGGAARRDPDRARRPATIQARLRHLPAGVSGGAVFPAHADGVRVRRQAGRYAVGFCGGILGGLAGLSGPLPILWASVRGWGKTERRGIFQVFNWTILLPRLCCRSAAASSRWS